MPIVKHITSIDEVQKAKERYEEAVRRRTSSDSDASSDSDEPINRMRRNYQVAHPDQKSYDGHYSHQTTSSSPHYQSSTCSNVHRGLPSSSYLDSSIYQTAPLSPHYRANERPIFSDIDSSTSLPHEHAPRISERTAPINQEDSTFSIILDALEDIEQELVLFVSFKRTGQYDKAHKIFHDVLSTHLSVFPVVAEYADLLLHQGHYQVLSDFLDIQLQCMKAVFTEDEIQLLLIMKSLAGVYTHGALRSALIQASRTWKFLADAALQVRPGNMPDDIQIHIFEVYMTIIAFGLATSNWVSLGDMKCPWVTISPGGCTGFAAWYIKLSQQASHLWEASRALCILCTLIPNLPIPDIDVLFDAPCFGTLPTQSSTLRLSKADRIVAYTVSSSRARALLNIALLRFSITQNGSSQSLWERALSYHSAADSIVRIIHAETGDELLLPEINIYKLEFHLAGALLGQAMSVDKLADISVDEFMRVTSREARQSYISMLIQSLVYSYNDESHPLHSKFSLLPHYVSRMLEAGDLLGCIQARQLCYDVMQQLSNTEKPEKIKKLPYAILDDLPLASIDFESTHSMQEVQAQLWALCRILPCDGVKVDFGPGFTFQDTTDGYPEQFDIPAYLIGIHKLELLPGSISGLSYLNTEGDNIGAAKFHLPCPVEPSVIEVISLELTRMFNARPAMSAFDASSSDSAKPEQKVNRSDNRSRSVRLPLRTGHPSLNPSSPPVRHARHEHIPAQEDIVSVLIGSSNMSSRDITTETSNQSLDPRYMVQANPRTFFKRGRIFSVLWQQSPEMAGDHHTFASQRLFPTIYGQSVYSYIRRLVVVKEHAQCAWCVPIYTYNGRGLSKYSADASKHAIIFMEGLRPVAAPNEPRMSREPIEVRPDSWDLKLDPTSRLNFGKLFTVEHNVKVLPVGKITERSMLAFLNYAQQELSIS